MYGRENMAVVQPTKAVSATRKTLNGSTKNCSFPNSKGPSTITRRVSATLARKVPKLSATLTSGARRWAPTSAKIRLPARGMPRSNASSMSFLFELFEMLQIKAVELLADLEKEHAEDHRTDEYIQRDAEFDDHGHAVRGASRGKEQPVLHGEKSDNLRDRLAPGDHHQKRKHHHGQGDAERAARDAGG